jgi:hypothetical protein
MGSAILDIGGETGALVVYADADLEGEEVEIASAGETRPVAHNVVRARDAASGPVFAAVFPEVRTGAYRLIDRKGLRPEEFFVSGGRVCEVDCRARQRSAQDPAQDLGSAQDQ